MFGLRRLILLFDYTVVPHNDYANPSMIVVVKFVGRDGQFKTIEDHRDHFEREELSTESLISITLY